MEHRIRQARLADIPTVKYLVEKGVTEGSLQRRTYADIAYHTRHFAVASYNRSVVGCCGLVPYNGRIGEIRSLYVLPAFRGEGLAREMVLFLLDKPNTPENVFAITQSPTTFEKVGFQRSVENRTILFLANSRRV